MIADKEQKKYKVRSLLEPEITVTAPGGDRLKTVKAGVHPTNAFDQGDASGLNTPHDSDTELEISDIRRAQKLAILVTPVTSTPETQRSVRTIYRGDFTQMQKEAEEDQRRVRKYLVATDLSEEAAHALEWTIGTVLRDGDTLLAIYCVDEDTGIIPESGSGTADALSIDKQAESIAAAAKSLPSHLTAISSHLPSPLGSGTPRSGVSASPMTRDRSHAEQERYRAVEDITDRVSKLLRKTKLQVRVVIEVIHCKSPKHLICEVIDYFNPTLVILGSRGRSALKGFVISLI
jgi:nucleotide-binding universal stress UspA family protein